MMLNREAESTMTCRELTMPHKYCNAYAITRPTNKFPAMIALTVFANESDNCYSTSCSTLKLGFSKVGTSVTTLLCGELAAFPDKPTNTDVSTTSNSILSSDLSNCEISSRF